MAETSSETAEAPDIESRIRAALDEVRPALQFDGGDLEFLDYSPDSGVVRIQMVGACHGCAMSEMTLTAGLERIVKERVPEVRSLINVPPDYEPTNPKY